MKTLTNLARSPVGEAARALVTSIVHEFWRLRNPGVDSSHFYARRIERKIGRGHAHPTLGRRAWSGAEGDLSRDWTPDGFAERGRSVAQHLARLGLRPGMTCVDYGCGSLRVGQHLMRTLDRGAYTGLDVTDSFYRAGLGIIDPVVLAEKVPSLGVISDELIEELATTPPDFLFASAVVQHVPPDELPLFMGRIVKLIGPGTKAVVLFVAGKRAKRFGPINWRYAPHELEAAARAVAPDLEIEFELVKPASRDRRGRERQAMLLRRREAVGANVR